jgi:hypothetical protein
MLRTKQHARKGPKAAFPFGTLPREVQNKIVNHYLAKTPMKQKITIQTNMLRNNTNPRRFPSPPPGEEPNDNAKRFLDNIGVNFSNLEKGNNFDPGSQKTTKRKRRYRMRVTAPKPIRSAMGSRRTGPIPDNSMLLWNYGTPWGGANYNITWNVPKGPKTSYTLMMNAQPTVHFSYMVRPPKVGDFPKLILKRDGKEMQAHQLANGATDIQFRTLSRYNNIHTPNAVSKQFRNRVKAYKKMSAS